MACPKCGCKVHYQYDDGDDCGPHTEGLERCAACGEIFDIEDATDDEDEPADLPGLTRWKPPPYPATPTERDALAKRRADHIRSVPGGAAFLRVAAAAAVPPAPCPSYGRCTYPDCGHFLDVAPRVVWTARIFSACFVPAYFARPGAVVPSERA